MCALSDFPGALSFAAAAAAAANDLAHRWSRKCRNRDILQVCGIDMMSITVHDKPRGPPSSGGENLALLPTIFLSTFFYLPGKSANKAAFNSSTTPPPPSPPSSSNFSARRRAPSRASDMTQNTHRCHEKPRPAAHFSWVVPQRRDWSASTAVVPYD